MAVSGTATLDFGSANYTHETSVVIKGQAAIVGTSRVEAWLRLEATADHDLDALLAEGPEMFISAGNIVAGTGFTIYARTVGPVTGQVKTDWVWE
jgi:hypothetical protein